MLTNGAEVSRVEETLNRMGHAYGATQMNVFAITSSIVVTMVFEEGEEYTYLPSRQTLHQTAL